MFGKAAVGVAAEVYCRLHAAIAGLSAHSGELNKGYRDCPIRYSAMIACRPNACESATLVGPGMATSRNAVTYKRARGVNAEAPAVISEAGPKRFGAIPNSTTTMRRGMGDTRPKR